MDTKTLELNYTYAEIHHLLSSLSEPDIARLIQIYRVMGCEERAGMTAHDVFHEVACKVLALERSWPRQIDTLPYLVETGRSVITNISIKHTREVNTDQTELGSVAVAPDPAVSWITRGISSPNTQAEVHHSDLLVNEWIEKIKDLFAGDDDATCFITQKLADMKKSAILFACKFTEQTYLNVVKRIKDKVRKRYPKGFPWWEIE